MAWQFQNRRRNSGNSGNDFEDFVFETLRIARGEHGLAKKMARGRDGAIDLIDRKSAPGATAVVECKYIGSAEAKEARGRWAEVHKNLSNNLPELWIDPSKAPLSPYRDWLNPDSPVTSYRFCVTAIMSEPELTALEDQIKSDFASLFKQGIEPLRSLAESPGAIQVLRWDWFVAELDSAPSLAYRWFRGLPVGVELLDPARDAQTSFRAFLHSDALPYFSRDQFRQAEGGAVNNSEAALVDQLLNGRCQALLISGPGGAGKTRLSLELAQALAASAESFDVYRLERSATHAAILELVTAYPDDGAIAFVVDYAESVTDLAGVADAVHHLAENSGHKVRLIATCRASATTQVRDALEVIDPQMLDMGSAQMGEEAFANWVVRSILAVGPAPLAGELDRVCHGLPGLAAFALYLYRYHRARFDAQFGTLHGLDDFGKWARHRIAMLVSAATDRSAEEAWLARLALAIPISAEHFATLRAERPSLAGHC